ncbi:MAG: UV DNA damage repair endonuclease UvsE [Clostridiaceae bacterium]
MKFRLGYVAMTLDLEDCSPSGTVTYTALKKLAGDEARLHRLRRTAQRNLLNTLRILKLNKAMDIQVYRLTSKLIPLATHPDLQNWRYVDDFADDLREIGKFILQNDFRVSLHPDHYTLINSPIPKVLADSLRDLDYHVKLYEAMGLGDTRYKLVMHVGGMYGRKQDSMSRFCDQFIKLPDRIRNRIIIENDDRSYNTYDVLELSQKLHRPMVLDVHHHNCLCGGISDLGGLLPEIFDTWKGEYFPPKVHFSSPRSSKDFRSHADFINFDEFIGFMKIAANVHTDFDIMLEAKYKDAALLKLSDGLAAAPGFRRVGLGEFIKE